MGIKTVRVVFMSGNANNGYVQKQYEYLTTLDVKAGDVAIVDSPNDGYVTVRVKSVQDGEIGKISKFIVQLVDDTEYKNTLAKHLARKEIIKQLEAKKKQVEEMQVWKWLADNDSEAAELLKKLKDI